MRVLCTANSGSNLSAKHFERGYASPSSEFDLEVGKEYVVYGIILWKGFLLYLILGEGMFPHWYPAELFSVTRNELPPDWYFVRRREEDGFEVNAIWGYGELVNTEDHFDALSNLEKRAIDVFVERKKRIDEIS
jgi:hypothetical protein